MFRIYIVYSILCSAIILTSVILDVSQHPDSRSIHVDVEGA